MNEFWRGFFDIMLRSVLSLTILFLLARLMGKRQISQLTFFDYVVGISIGSITAQFATNRNLQYTYGILALAIFASYVIVLSFITFKNVRARQVVEGVPTVLIQNGKFVEENLKKERFHINDVLEQCRIRGAFNLKDIEYAILEPSGKVSVLKKSQSQPVTPSDMNIPTNYKGLESALIIDGVIMHKHLENVKLDEKWLKEELKKRGVHDVEDVLYSSLDTSGNLYIDIKGKSPEPQDVLE